jgi:hypothetical protein
MSKLDYAVEPDIECSDNDLNDATFIRATSTVGGHNAIEEYVACKMYPLDVGFDFKSVPLGMTPISRVETPLPLFVVGTIAIEHVDRVLAGIETKVERVLGSFGLGEYDALGMANILNDSCLNRVLE